MTPEALATFFASNVALPRRTKGNVCASAQYIETNKRLDGTDGAGFCPTGRADSTLSLSRGAVSVKCDRQE
ncbi:hypothetical protein ABIB85_004364 [Bradyrhizobium sp. JR1.5]|uniref:hypothetical protein n=1 Tax=unclassified Bradyrhizobium TaxID=2631580 RepID=UPI00339B48A5